MATLWQDIKYGFRMLVRSPGFTALVVVILTIGIGATTVMLSIMDAVVFRSCPYKDPATLVCVYETDNGVKQPFTSLAGFRDWQQQNHVFAPLVGADQWNGIVRSADRTERSRGHCVSPDFFSALGVQPILGRTFLPEEHRRGGQRVLVLSYDHWHHWFAGDPNVIGRTLILAREVYTVVGVLPESFRWTFQRVACGLWMPLTMDNTNTNRDHRGLLALARLRPAVTMTQAQAEMNLIAQRLAQAYPETNAQRGILVVPINEAYADFGTARGQSRTMVALAAVVLSILLVACLHVASLLIARSAAREQEIVVRAALGAHRLRLARQLLTESALLAALSGVCGTVLAYWALGVLSTLRGQSIPWTLGPGVGRLIPWFLDIRMDAKSLLYVTGVSLLTCAAFGLLPALGISKARLNEAMSAGRTPGQAPRFHSLRAGLVVLDIGVAFVLLIGAGLMLNSYARILQIDLQVNTRNVLTTSIDLSYDGNPYSQPQERLAFSQRIMEGIGRLPGVQSVAVANGTPAWAGYNGGPFIVEGFPPNADRVDIRFTPVSVDYFRLFQIPLLKGRLLTEYDDDRSTPVAIISESLAKRLWPDEEPLGRHLTSTGSKPVTREIIGVVRDVKHLGDFPDEEVYASCLQVGGLGYPDVMVRVDRWTADLPAAIRREILAVDSEALVSNVSLLEQEIADKFSTERLHTLLLSASAAMSLLLAGLGVYGTTAYVVSRRTHEIGIRMALGARRGDILKAVLRQGLTLTGIGLTTGLAGALAGTRVIRSLLYDVSPTDPVTFVCVGLLLAGVALLACYLPARRAARIDPMVALRYE
jgi:predicted permease